MAAAAGGELKVPAVSVLPAEDVAAPVADLNDKEQAVKRRARPGRKLNGVVRGDTRSLYISPSEPLFPWHLQFVFFGRTRADSPAKWTRSSCVELV